MLSEIVGHDGFWELPSAPVTLPSVSASERYRLVPFTMFTVPVCPVLAIRLPFGSALRTTSPTAVTRSRSHRLVPPPAARNTLPFEWTRPPKSKSPAALNARSTDENMPNWKTGMATVSTRRVRCTSPRVGVRAVLSMS